MYKKTEFVAKLASKGFTKAMAGDIYDIFIDCLKEAIDEDGSVLLFGFGKFEVRTCKGHSGMNFQTGEAMDVPDFKRLKFTTSNMYKRHISGKDAETED